MFLNYNEFALLRQRLQPLFDIFFCLLQFFCMAADAVSEVVAK